jgi:hypothetical protein
MATIDTGIESDNGPPLTRIQAWPTGPGPATRPVAETVATAGLLLLNVNVEIGIA